MTGQIRYPVYVTAAPASINRLNKIRKALTVLHGETLYMTNPHGVFAFWTEGEECHCRKCAEELERMIQRSKENGWWGGAGMIVCPECGNKRCPQADNHEYWCTGSNAPDQKPSWKNWDPNPRRATTPDQPPQT
jgi:hypothetical protein